MVAINIADGTIKWRTPPTGDTCRGRQFCSTGQPAAVSAIPGMVFSAGLDGHLRGYEAETGQVIFDTGTGNCSRRSTEPPPPSEWQWPQLAWR